MTILLILLCCFMGAVSAADDVSADFSGTIDDAITVDAVSEDISDSATVEETQVSDETTTEETSDGIKNDEISEESAIVDSEPTRATDVDVDNWADLRDFSQKTNANYNIHLTNIITCGSNKISFANSATIIGTPNNYITGSFSGIPFESTGSLDITFENVTFKDMSAQVLIKLATTGTNKFINCKFDNITTTIYKSSVIWNDKGYMNISGCNFTNCVNGFGAVTNFATSGSVQMDVENCRFINNSARNEPGAINNCGNMTVTNCTFIHNVANWWAGAIHTHTFANTTIVDSTFTDNVAGGKKGSGWNGGALFSYGNLIVRNSNFTENKCNVSTGGGAIFGYSYQGSIYNITVDSCNFIRNRNNNTNGKAGAIGVQNIGYLKVFNSTFINNYAKNGSAIAAICENVSYCTNCTNCSCPNCPNCTNCSHNVSTGDPNCNLTNNTYINHTGTGDTVIISGNNYNFDYNIFINSTQTVHYNGTGNQYDLLDYPSPSSSPALLHASLDTSVLCDRNPHDIIYVNESSSNNPRKANVTGQNWTDAFGTDDGLPIALDDITNNGIIYLADTTFTQFGSGTTVNCTLIGLDREKTIFDAYEFWGYDGGAYESSNQPIITYINITFKNPKVRIVGSKVFINCTFINNPIILDENIYYSVIGAPENYHFEDSFVINFTNCEFKNSNFESSLLELYKYTQVNFNNCTFKDITANSIVNNTGGFTLQDAINFYDCTFDNVAVKGIVDVPAGTTPVERYRIEGCTGVESFGTVTADGHDYVNTTQSRTDTVLVADIDADGNLLVNLTDASGNAMAEEEVLISINGGEATPYTLGTDGLLSIALADLTDATGKLNIAVSFEENDDYKGSTGSVSTVLVINNVTVEVPVEVPVYITVNQTATSITASDLTATAKVAKTLSVTLKDANGKILANKAIKVTVNGKTSTVTTDKNGVAKVNVNYAKAGTYYYTLSFLGDNDYKASMKAVKVTVNKQATKATFAKKTFKVKATKKLTFTLKDAKGKAIKGKKITFTVNKKTYTAKTNAKGIATVKVKLTKKGKCTAVAKFAGDNTYKAISKKAKITVK